MIAIFDRRTMAATLIIAFIYMALSPANIVDAQDLSNDINNAGPYVDKVVFKVIMEHNQEILALQSGETDLMTEFFHPANFEILDKDPDISIHSALRYGYGHITINCGKYPLNISGFRRAFAYAFDKMRVRIEVFDGFSQEHDSLVPYMNDWCIEDQLPYHYYLAQPDIGNQILDNLGFDIDPVSGFRNAPDGSPFNVVIEYYTGSEEVAGSSARIGADALLSLHVNADVHPTSITTFFSRLDYHEDYDMVFYAFNFFTKDVDWLAHEYNGQNADVPTQNPCNFVNKTYDSWCSRLRYSTSYPQACEAAAAMQLILHENVPRLVVYDNIYNQAHRNDVFTGHVADLGRYIAGQWTFRKIHRIDGPPGGIVRVSIDQPLHTFNIFSSGWSFVNDLVWPRLYSIGPDLNLLPYIAENLLMETHADNPSVFDGHTRFTVDIIKNATWSDGTSLTANDIASTYTYFHESISYGNQASGVMNELVVAYAPTTYRAIIEFSTESIWHLTNFALTPIIPKHIFNEVDGISYDGWNNWNPVFNPEDPYVTAGPFVLTDSEMGEFYEFSKNPDFWYPAEDIITTTTTTSTGPTPFNPTLAIAAGAVGAAVVILVGGFYLFKIQEKDSVG